MSFLSAPHGGVLVDRELAGDAREEWLGRAREWPVLPVGRRTLSDLLCLATGVYSPLTGFMTRHDYWRVLDEMRLASGLVWSLPIVLPVPEDAAMSWREGQWVALVDEGGQPVAALRVEDRFLRDPVYEARQVFGTVDPRHPGVARLVQEPRVLVGGAVWLLNRPELAQEERQYVFDPKVTRARQRDRKSTRLNSSH